MPSAYSVDGAHPHPKLCAELLWSCSATMNPSTRRRRMPICAARDRPALPSDMPNAAKWQLPQGPKTALRLPSRVVLPCMLFVSQTGGSHPVFDHEPAFLHVIRTHAVLTA